MCLIGAPCRTCRARLKERASPVLVLCVLRALLCVHEMVGELGVEWSRVHRARTQARRVRDTCGRRGGSYGLCAAVPRSCVLGLGAAAVWRHASFVCVGR